MFDVSTLAIQESTVLHLTHPATGDKLYADKNQKKPVTITIASTSSKAYRQAVTAMHNRKLKRGKKQMSADESREEGIALLTAICIDSSELSYQGNPVKTETDFRALLSDDKLSWIKEQVDVALGDVENFIV
jgi:hypothetical protein